MDSMPVIITSTSSRKTDTSIIYLFPTMYILLLFKTLLIFMKFLNLRSIDHSNK